MVARSRSTAPRPGRRRRGWPQPLPQHVRVVEGEERWWQAGTAVLFFLLVILVIRIIRIILVIDAGQAPEE